MSDFIVDNVKQDTLLLRGFHNEESADLGLQKSYIYKWNAAIKLTVE